MEAKMFDVSHEVFLGPDSMRVSEEQLESELVALADHWDSLGEDSSLLRTFKDHGGGTWRLSDGSVIAREVQE